MAAISAFSPTGDGPLSCHFVGKPSQCFSRKRNRSIRPQRNQTALALSQLWRAHGGHRETYRRPTPTPLATLSLRSRSMKQPFPALSLSAPHHPQAGCALLASEQAICSQPRLKIPFLPRATSTKAVLRFAVSNSSSGSRSLSHSPRWAARGGSQTLRRRMCLLIQRLT